MKTVALAVAGAALVLAGALFLVGSLLPVGHRAEAEAIVPGSADAVWDRVCDVAAFPQWRRDLREVRVVGQHPLRWVEVDRDGEELPLELALAEPRRRLKTRIAGGDLPFGGTWTYDLTIVDGGRTRVRITEDGEVYHPVFRVASRLLMDPTQTLRSYLEDLGASFGPGEG